MHVLPHDKIVSVKHQFHVLPHGEKSKPHKKSVISYHLRSGPVSLWYGLYVHPEPGMVFVQMLFNRNMQIPVKFSELWGFFICKIRTVWKLNSSALITGKVIFKSKYFFSKSWPTLLIYTSDILWELNG